MEKRTNSIWGKWWEPIRKWFYPAWLIYETSYRFYDYSVAVYDFVENNSTQVFAVFGFAATFIICTAFLTIPASFSLFKFFREDDLTGTNLEAKMKVFF